ncbi:MAG: hypothetical protein HY711_09595 [Candidatus Melainabacteria bacterium]|nr:hypothetical protein [Candidatus Melainabacteria bacterium]
MAFTELVAGGLEPVEPAPPVEARCGTTTAPMPAPASMLSPKLTVIGATRRRASSAHPR